MIHPPLVFALKTPRASRLGIALLAATGAALLGTHYPLLLDNLDLGRVSVGAPHFDVSGWCEQAFSSADPRSSGLGHTTGAALVRSTVPPRQCRPWRG